MIAHIIIEEERLKRAEQAFCEYLVFYQLAELCIPNMWP